MLHRPATDERRATVHFLHATGFNAETYRSLFAQLHPTLDVYAMDARGHGFSEAPANPRRLHSWAPFRKDLESFVETLEQPTFLVGHSMGATVSMELAARRPDLVRGVIMIDPVMFPSSWTVRAGAARTFGLLSRMLPVSRMAAKRRMEFPSKEAAVENYTGKGAFKTWPVAWIQAYVDGGTRPVPSGVRLTCEREWEARVFAKPTVRPFAWLAKVSCPVSLVTREHDGPPFTHEARVEFERRKPDARIVVLEDATHFLAMEQPDVVQNEIEALIGSELG